MKKKFQRRTKRLEIRPLKTSDYRAWRDAFLVTLPVQNKFDNHRRESTRLTQTDFRKLLMSRAASQKNGDFYYYAIFDKKTGVYIGGLTLGHIIRSLTQSAILGYGLLNTHWGKGYASEAVWAVLDIAFRDHGLHRVVAGIESDNRQSLRIVKKLGFRREGLSKGIVYLRGDWRDLVQYAINSEDVGIKWKEHKN